MAMLSTGTTAKLAAKGVKTVARHPDVVRRGARAAVPAGRAAVRLGKPVAKRAIRHHTGEKGDTALRALETLGRVSRAARHSALVEPPPEKETERRVAVGLLVGAGVVYLLERNAGS